VKAFAEARPSEEPVALVPHAGACPELAEGICAGAVGQLAVLPRCPLRQRRFVVFNDHVSFSKLIVKVSLTGLLGALLLITGTVCVLSQMNGIEISPSHTRKVPSGQFVVYDHVLTNNTTFTDTFSLEVHSTQGWPVELLGEGYPTGTLMLPLQVGAQMTASFQISLTVPLSASGVTEITVITATSQISPTVWDTATDTTIVLSQIYLPLVVKRWPPIPYTPSLNSVSNSDQDNYYTVSWTSADLAQTYILEEAMSSNFSGARVVYQGSSLSWSVPSPGKTPGNYYYRVKAHNSWGDSPWSNARVVTIYPLFVGLQLRWDGNGYIRGSEYADVGWHFQRNLNGLTDADTIRSHYYSWYSPNPYGWDSETWDSYYSVTTGYFRSSSVPDDPAWKWGYPWILPYDWQFSNGQTVSIDGQAFTVSGPHSGYTAFGKLVQYWKLVNKNKFLFWDGGGSWKQYVHPGDITLHYESGNTRLLLYSDILRRDYYNGQITSNTVQYVENLTSANSFPTISAITTKDVEADRMEEVQEQMESSERGNSKPSPGW